MYTINPLKINKFKPTTIPSNKELFSRFGITKAGGNYTGNNAAPGPQTKIEQVAEVQKEAIAPEEE